MTLRRTSGLIQKAPVPSMPPTITNRHGTAHVTRLAGRTSIVHRANSWDAAYSHHPQVATIGGRLWATWSLGHLHEDAPGQIMVHATSDDLGQTWTAAQTLVPSVQGEHGPTCITSGGLHVGQDSIAAYASSYEITPAAMALFMESGLHHWHQPGLKTLQDVYTGVHVSRDGGATWSATGSRLPGFIPNLSPVRLSSGRLILTGHLLHAYTDDPAGLSGWQIATLPGLPEGYYEWARGFCPASGQLAELGICEGSVYEVSGQPLRMMLRTNRARLAVAESRDDGETWSEPELTDFTDCGSKMQFGRLPDGRYFALSCPDPNVPESCLRRTPLVLTVSRDGNVFDRHFLLGDEPDAPLRYPGGYKHGRYGYPYSHVVDDHLVVINSVGKEDIECHVFSLRDLED